MPLSDDKKAMLRLLAQSGQSYEDIAALMNLSVDEVHARVREAIDELEAEGIPAPTIAPPSADRPAKAASPSPVEHPSRPEDPVDSPARETPSASRAQSKPSRPPRPRRERPAIALPKRREARIGIGVAAAAVVAVVLILVLSSGGGNSTDTAATTPTAAAENAAAKEGKEVTKAVLGSVDGSEASGVAIFGRVKNRLALQVAARGLEPTGKSDAYTVWLAASPQKMLPLASTQVGKDGRINAQVEVPTEVLAYLADETFAQIAVTRTSKAELQASLEAATAKKEAPAYTGTPVLRGAVTGPIVGAAKN